MLRELLAHPDVTELCELRGRFGVMAYHGGNLERSSDAVAAEVAERTGSSFYAVLQHHPLRHHIPSTAFDPAHSQALARFLDHVDVVITVHGYGRRALRHHLLLGGRNRKLAAHVAAHLRAALPARYRVVDDLEAIPRALRGQHARNPVNRPPQAGVQIELPPSIRWNRREWGWSDHRGVGRTPAIARLIDALSLAVESWSGDDCGPRPEKGVHSRHAQRPGQEAQREDQQAEAHCQGEEGEEACQEGQVVVARPSLRAGAQRGPRPGGAGLGLHFRAPR